MSWLKTMDCEAFWGIAEMLQEMEAKLVVVMEEVITGFHPHFNQATDI